MYCVCVCLPPPLLLPPCSDWVCLIECSERGGLRQCWHSGSGRPPLGMTADHSSSQHPNYPEMEGAKEGGGGRGGPNNKQVAVDSNQVCHPTVLSIPCPPVPNSSFPSCPLTELLWPCRHRHCSPPNIFYCTFPITPKSSASVCVWNSIVAWEHTKPLSELSLRIHTHTHTFSKVQTCSQSHTLMYGVNQTSLDNVVIARGH